MLLFQALWLGKSVNLSDVISSQSTSNSQFAKENSQNENRFMLSKLNPKNKLSFLQSIYRLWGIMANKVYQTVSRKT